MREYDLPLEQVQRIVTSVRIRLARNFENYFFSPKLPKEQGNRILEIIDPVLKGIDDFKKYEMSKITQTEALILQEQHLISPALLRNKSCGAAYISQSEEENDWVISLMVNEEDHLREQCILRGDELEKAYEIIMGVDEELGQECRFAFDEKLGYLTACPSNLGTGMRASAMLFLPGMARDGSIKEILPKMKASGMTIRGVFGEGSDAEGYEYQVSNERTLGVSENKIISVMKETIDEFCALEVCARQKMLEEEGAEWENVCMRAYGLLTNCTLLTDGELTEEIAKIRLGMALGFFEADDVELQRFYDFIKNTRSASFFARHGRMGMSEREVDELRANFVRETLPCLVKKP